MKSYFILKTEFIYYVACLVVFPSKGAQSDGQSVSWAMQDEPRKLRACTGSFSSNARTSQINSLTQLNGR